MDTTCKRSKTEKKMQHTEGPWQVGELIENDYDPRHVTVKGNDGVKLIAKAYYGKTDEECAENAHLLAAAPELLEVIKQAWGDILDGDYISVETRKAIEKAIDKAEGRCRK